MQLEDTRMRQDSGRLMMESFAAFGGAHETLSALDLAQVCIRGTDGTIRYWSRGNERLYGWSREEAVGEITHELLETKFPKPLLEIEAELMRNGQWEGELEHVSKSGGAIWAASHWVLQPGGKNFASYVVEVNNDVSGLKRADQALRQLGAIVESSDDAIVSKDPNGLVTSWNLGAERLFGYTASEMLGKSIMILFPPELAGEEDEIMARLRMGERIDHFETTRVTKSGRQIAVSVTISPLFNAHGLLIGASKIARDISPKKEWERALIATESRRRLAAEAGELGLWSYDLVTGPNWDAVCEQIFGFPGETPSPSYPEVIGFVHPDDRNRVDLRFKATLEQGTPFDADFRILNQQGQVRWVQSKGRPSLGEEGEIVGAHGTLLDFTARKAREEALRRANQELEQFAYAAAHDLQEPLRNTALSIGLAKQELEHQLNAEAEAFLDYGMQSSQKMLSMVRDLLAYAKAVGDGREQAPVIDSRKVLDQALENIAGEIAAACAEVRVGELLSVCIQPVHLLQLFQNLIGNALKYCSSEAPVVEIAASRRSGFQEFSVKDNGIGIDPQFHERVFGVFKRLREKETSGTGIGLAICKRIVEHYGGKIWIRSAKGEGATFLFTVPGG